ncbi:MAG: hypothetical protein IID42_11075 [Planctomycetes bacterium]|nr:hypothetical protein [Planctomycetota bacterium]
MALLAFAPLLQADTVETKRGQSFEGIVVGFSEKTLRLNTGYGTLRFDRKSQVADVTRSLYNWPGEDDAPERTEAFEKRNDPKSAAEVAKEAKLKKFPRRHGKDEMTGAAFRDRLVAFTEFVESGTNSAKEKRKKFKATKFKYIYVTAPVQSIEVESIENDATGESEDRLRRPRRVSMWNGLKHFADTACAAYRRIVWADQPEYIEVWLEKDALSGIFEEALRPYGVTLNVGRGFDGWDSIHNAAGRLSDYDTILYFGDFDPSGEDMVRSLRERLAFFDTKPEIIKCALTADDIRRYGLPTDFAKKTDTRSAAFIAKHGDVSVELDALPMDVLRERLVSEVEARMDLEALAETKAEEDAERERLREALA